MNAASNITWVAPTYTTTTTAGPYFPAVATPPKPFDEIEWLRGRIEEITELCA